MGGERGADQLGHKRRLVTNLLFPCRSLVDVEVSWSSGYVAGLSITRSAVRVPLWH